MIASYSCRSLSEAIAIDREKARKKKKQSVGGSAERGKKKNHGGLG